MDALSAEAYLSTFVSDEDERRSHEECRQFDHEQRVALLALISDALAKAQEQAKRSGQTAWVNLGNSFDFANHANDIDVVRHLGRARRQLIASGPGPKNVAGRLS